MEPEKHDSPFQRKKKQHASQQINPSPPTAARPQHRTIPRRAPSIRYANRRIHTKIRTATPAAIAPRHRSTPTPSESKTSELQNHSGGRKTRLHAHRARRAGPDTRHETSHAIPIPHHLHQIGNADIEKNINLPKMEKVADDLETWRTRSNEKRGEYDAPIARMEASGTGLNRLTVHPVFGTPPRRPWQPWKWKAWQKARERESLASNGFDYIHN